VQLEIIWPIEGGLTQKQLETLIDVGAVEEVGMTGDMRVRSFKLTRLGELLLGRTRQG